MKTTIDISSVMSDIDLPKRNLEVIANYKRPKHGRFTKGFELSGYEDISWQFLYALGIGNVQMTLLNKQNHRFTYRQIPASAKFMAVCTKTPCENYKLKFGISLS